MKNALRNILAANGFISWSVGGLFLATVHSPADVFTVPQSGGTPFYGDVSNSYSYGHFPVESQQIFNDGSVSVSTLHPDSLGISSGSFHYDIGGYDDASEVLRIKGSGSSYSWAGHGDDVWSQSHTGLIFYASKPFILTTTGHLGANAIYGQYYDGQVTLRYYGPSFNPGYFQTIFVELLPRGNDAFTHVYDLQPGCYEFAGYTMSWFQSAVSTPYTLMTGYYDYELHARPIPDNPADGSGSLLVSDGWARLSWNVTPNRSYKVQTSADLQTWSDWPAVTPTTNKMTIFEAINASKERYYRLQLAPQ